MINIDQLKRLVELLSNKNQNGQFTPARFNDAVKASEIELFNDYYGLSQQSQNGRTANDVYWQANEYSSNVLRPFLEPPTTITIDQNGYAQKPINFVQLSSMRVSYTNGSSNVQNTQNCEGSFVDCEVECEDQETNVVIKEMEAKFVNDSELGKRLESTFLQPSLDFPIFVIYRDRFRFYPASLNTATITYLRKPIHAVWNFTVSAQGRPIYNPVTSIDSEFDENMLNELAHRICSRLGIHLSRQDLLQYSEARQQQGG